jgi:hypothetical protein
MVRYEERLRTLHIFKRIRPWRSRRVAQATPTKIFGVVLYDIDVINLEGCRDAIYRVSSRFSTPNQPPQN